MICSWYPEVDMRGYYCRYLIFFLLVKQEWNGVFDNAVPLKSGNSVAVGLSQLYPVNLSQRILDRPYQPHDSFSLCTILEKFPVIFLLPTVI